MKNSVRIAAIAIIAILCSSLAYADDFITIRLSYKVVLNPADGKRPPAVTDKKINDAVAGMNTLMATYYRGLRFQRVGAITEVGAKDDTTGPSIWYSTDFFEDGGLYKMEEAAKNDQATYAWDVNAINIYITNGISGGICSYPPKDIIVVGSSGYTLSQVQLHEIGHYFDLCHTQGCPCECWAKADTDCNKSPGDDGVDDTLPDVASWDDDWIAEWSFNQLYNELTTGQKNQVDDVFKNIMSYHDYTNLCGARIGNATTRLTELQLDKWTDTASWSRRNVTNGRTHFVKVGGTRFPFSSGSSTNPHGSVSTATFWVKDGDIILLRAGYYNEKVKIDKKRVTLRATRGGPVVIGSSPPASLIAVQNRMREALVETAKKIQIAPSTLTDTVRVRLGFAGEDKKE